MDDEDFLAAVEADNANVPVEEPSEAPAEETPLELTEEAPPAPAETPAEPAQPEARPEPQNVPITALLDERDKRKALETELAQFRAQQQPQQAPDMFEDPDGYAAYQDRKVQAALYDTNLRWSERVATVEHGAETVGQAKEWGLARCDADPYFNAKVAASPDPVGFVVSEWKREQVASQVTPEELTQFQAWKAAQAAIQNPPPPSAAETPPPRTIPPRSLASAPSAGGIATEPEQSDEEMFAEVIPKR
jgi:hypothetical protein